MNVALPSIMVDLKITESTAQWITTGFMLVNGVLIPVTAFLMERFSTRQLFITAISLFALGTLICGISPDFSTLMAGRVIQAIGAGIIMPLLTTVILAIFPVEKRGGAMGLIGIAMIFAPAVGPTLSGFVVQNYSWRVLFYIILPIALIDIIIAPFFLKKCYQTNIS
ncbi:MFS transporter [Virgibacillus halophilus]|uniref:MFS transporter n=1 Tax=Tigheibacillus halophilus TaxID=361280 RepID=A0ABU5C7Y8_9BACI|nr:MFS transporter [Virgibacillus halophilus]